MFRRDLLPPEARDCDIFHSFILLFSLTLIFYCCAKIVCPEIQSFNQRKKKILKESV